METATPEVLKKAAAHLSKSDPFLATIITTAPLPAFAPHTNYYQSLVESIISQQLSVKAAETITNRFKDLFSKDFPTPEQILSKEDAEFREAGLSWQKAGYIKDLARKVEDGSVRFDYLNILSDDEVIAELTQIKGVGVWTVHMFLMFCMGRLDILPVGDLGIKNGMKRLYNLNEKPTTQDLEAVAEQHHWSPYRTVASWYIWYSLDNKPAL